MRAVKHLTAAVKAPTKEGVFDGAILYNPAEGDSDGERVANFINTPTTVPLDFQHLIVMDPGSVIGQIKAVEVGDGKTLAVHGELSIGNKMADAVFERMELDSGDPMVLKELSIAYAYDPSLNTKDANGVIAIHDAELLAISVVHAGAQPTRVFNIKSELDVLEKTALAGLISVEQAIKYAEDLGVPGDVSQKLFEGAATAEGVKFVGSGEAPVGSYEERQGDINEALNAFAGPDGWAYAIATYSDHVVACVETTTDCKTLSFPYTYDGETVTLGQSTEVEVEMRIVEAGKTLNLGTLHEHLMAAAPRGHGMSQDQADAVTYSQHDVLPHDEHTHPTRLDPGIGTAKARGEKWDGSAAMRSAKSAADFRKIAFERANDSDPDTAAHWALPHHSSPGAEADKTGVAAALAALNGARGGAPDLKDKGAAQSHLERHQASFGEKSEELSMELGVVTEDGKTGTITLSAEQIEEIAEKAGRVIGAKRVSDLKSSLNTAIDDWAKVVNGDLAAADKAEEIDELQARLDELVADQKAAETAAKAAELEAEVAQEVDAVAEKAKELEAEVAGEVEAQAEAERAEKAKAAQEELDDFNLRLQALAQ